MDILGYNYPQIASAYSAFAGVLAGIVFAVMGYLLTSREDDDQGTRKFESALSWAVLAFIGLSVSCFLYAVISGEDRYVTGSTLPSIRPFYLSMFGSFVFTSSLLILLVALIWLFHGERAVHSVTIQLRLAVYLTSLTTLLFLTGLFSAVSKIQNQSASAGAVPWVTIISVWLLAIALGEGIGWLLRSTPQRLQTAMRVLTQVILLAAIFAGAGLLERFGFGSQKGDDGLYQDILGYQTTALAALGVVIFICVLNLPGKRPKKQ